MCVLLYALLNACMCKCACVGECFLCMDPVVLVCWRCVKSHVLMQQIFYAMLGLPLNRTFLLHGPCGAGVLALR